MGEKGDAEVDLAKKKQLAINNTFPKQDQLSE